MLALVIAFIAGAFLGPMLLGLISGRNKQSA